MNTSFGMGGMNTSFDIEDNADRLQLLKDIASVYVLTEFYKWDIIYELMPKYEDDPIGIEYLLYLEAFQYWILIEGVNPAKDRRYYCALAMELIKGHSKGSHKLPLGSIPLMFSIYCKDFLDNLDDDNNS